MSRTEPTSSQGTSSQGPSSPGPGGVQPGERAVAPFRRPRPSRGGTALMGLWALGGVIGAGAPALIVPPNSDGASLPRLLGAFSLTLVGVAIMVLAIVALYRRGRDGGVLVLAVVPTGVLLAGGMMMLGTQLF